MRALDIARAPRCTIDRPIPVPLVATLIFGLFVVGTDEMVLSPLLHGIAAEFRIGESHAGTAVVLQGTTLAVASLLISVLSPRWRRQKQLAAGFLTFTVGAAVAAAAPNYPSLVLSRVLAGAGEACVIPATYALIAEAVPYERRGRAMGYVMFGWAGSLIIGVPAATLLSGAYGWRSAFLPIAAFGLMAIFAALPEARTGGGDTEEQLHEDGADRFGNFRRRIAEIARDRFVILLLAANLLNMASFYGAYTYLGEAIWRANWNKEGHMPLVVLVYGLGLATATLRSGVVDFLGKSRSFSLAGIGLIATQLALPHVLSSGVVIVPVFVWGALQGIALTSLTTMITKVSSSIRGSVTAVLSTSTYLGAALGSGTGAYAFLEGGFAAVCFMTSAFAALSVTAILAGSRFAPR